MEVEDEQHANKNKNEVVQGICHSNINVWTLVPTGGRRKRRLYRGGNELANLNSGQDYARQDS